jgi:hypothetical protein
MKKTLWKVGLLSAAAVLFTSSSASAQATATASLNVTVNVAARARLTLGAAALNFADADPATVPTLTSAALSVDVGARTSPTGNVTLTVLATGDLASGTDNIAINTLTWTATGTGFAAGTSSAATAQSVGAWTGPGARTGSQTYSLPNSWAYAPGTYTTTLNYTLTVP